MKNEDYTKIVDQLGLSLYYDLKKPPTRKLAVKGSEGPFAFPTIEPGIEDYQGVAALVNNLSAVELLSKKAIAAMLMVDF